MSGSDEPDRYQTYVLRLWQARYHGKWQWRASVEGPDRGERHAFASMEQVFAFMSERCERQAMRVAKDGPAELPGESTGPPGQHDG